MAHRFKQSNLLPWSTFGELPQGDLQPSVAIEEITNPKELFGFYVPNVPQRVILIGGLLPPPLSENHSAFALAHHILCGAFGSRANLRLREELGYTYGVHSARSYQRGGGHLVCSCSVEKERTEDALHELKDIFSLRGDKGPLTEKEVEEAKRSMPANALIRQQAISVLGRSLGQFLCLGLPLEEWSRFYSTGFDTTFARVEHVAKEHFHPSRLTFAIIGDFDDLGLGEITRVSSPFGGL